MRFGGCAVACLAALAVGVSACGEDEGGPTKESFLSQADAVCRSAESSFRISGPEPVALARRADALDRLVGQLAALQPPSSLDGAVEEYLDNLREIARQLRILAPATEGGGSARAPVIEIAQLLTENVRLVRDIGFESCTREGDPRGAG